MRCETKQFIFQNNVIFWGFFWGKSIRLVLRELRKIFSSVFEQFNEKYLNTVYAKYINTQF